jgi:hypothetical protein
MPSRNDDGLLWLLGAYERPRLGPGTNTPRGRPPGKGNQNPGPGTGNVPGQGGDGGQGGGGRGGRGGRGAPGVGSGNGGGGGGGGGGGASYDYLWWGAGGWSGATSLGSRPLGEEAADRIIVVTIGWARSGLTRTLDSVTLDGNNMTRLHSAVGGAASNEDATVWYIEYPTGATGTIVANFSGSGGSASHLLHQGYALYGFTVTGAEGFGAANITGPVNPSGGSAGDFVAMMATIGDGYGATTIGPWIGGEVDATTLQGSKQASNNSDHAAAAGLLTTGNFDTTTKVAGSDRAALGLFPVAA